MKETDNMELMTAGLLGASTALDVMETLLAEFVANERVDPDAPWLSINDVRRLLKGAREAMETHDLETASTTELREVIANEREQGRALRASRGSSGPVLRPGRKYEDMTAAELRELIATEREQGRAFGGNAESARYHLYRRALGYECEPKSGEQS